MYTFKEAALHPAAEVGAESQALGRLAAPIAPGFVVGASFEERFYRTTNLPEQLGRRFARLNPRRVDEDELEVLCGQAQALVRGSSLLDDSVQLFYRALGNAGLADTVLHLRRPAERTVEAARTRPPGAEALHALKRLWTRDWGFEAVLARLDDSGSVALDARPTLIFVGEAGQPDPAASAGSGAAQVWVNRVGIVGLG